jgi:hypothetical protein
MKAEPLFREKRLVLNRTSGELATVELKIWKVPKSTDYPAARKYSLFLVSNGEVVVGIDNHKPKGPHLHLGNKELSYEYLGDGKLMGDFWDLVRKAGFEI